MSEIENLLAEYRKETYNISTVNELHKLIKKYMKQIKDLMLSEEEIEEVMEEYTKNHPIARSEIWQEGNRKMIAKAIIQARDKKLNKD